MNFLFALILSIYNNNKILKMFQSARSSLNRLPKQIHIYTSLEQQSKLVSVDDTEPFPQVFKPKAKNHFAQDRRVSGADRYKSRQNLIDTKKQMAQKIQGSRLNEDGGVSEQLDLMRVGASQNTRMNLIQQARREIANAEEFQTPLKQLNFSVPRRARNEVILPTEIGAQFTSGLETVAESLDVPARGRHQTQTALKGEKIMNTSPRAFRISNKEDQRLKQFLDKGRSGLAVTLISRETSNEKTQATEANNIRLPEISALSPQTTLRIDIEGKKGRYATSGYKKKNVQIHGKNHNGPLVHVDSTPEITATPFSKSGAITHSNQSSMNRIRIQYDSQINLQTQNTTSQEQNIFSPSGTQVSINFQPFVKKRGVIYASRRNSVERLEPMLANVQERQEGRATVSGKVTIETSDGENTGSVQHSKSRRDTQDQLQIRNSQVNQSKIFKHNLSKPNSSMHLISENTRQQSFHKFPDVYPKKNTQLSAKQNTVTVYLRNKPPKKKGAAMMNHFVTAIENDKKKKSITSKAVHKKAMMLLDDIQNSKKKLTPFQSPGKQDKWSPSKGRTSKQKKEEEKRDFKREYLQQSIKLLHNLEQNQKSLEGDSESISSDEAISGYRRQESEKQNEVQFIDPGTEKKKNEKETPKSIVHEVQKPQPKEPVPSAQRVVEKVANITVGPLEAIIINVADVLDRGLQRTRTHGPNEASPLAPEADKEQVGSVGDSEWPKRVDSNVGVAGKGERRQPRKQVHIVDGSAERAASPSLQSQLESYIRKDTSPGPRGQSPAAGGGYRRRASKAGRHGLGLEGISETKGSSLREPERKAFVKMISPGKKYMQDCLASGEVGLTATERQLKERRAHLYKVMTMGKEERRQALLEMGRRALAREPVDAEQQAKLDTFLDKLNRQWDFPSETLQRLIMLRIEGIQRGGVEPGEELKRTLQRDDLVVGLCLLNEIRNERAAEVSDAHSQASGASNHLELVTKAMVTLESFVRKNGQRQGQPQGHGDEYLDRHRSLDFDRLLASDRGSQIYNTPTSGAEDQGISIPQSSEVDSQVPEDWGRTRQEWFKSDVYQDVVGTLFSEPSSRPGAHLDKQEISVQRFARNISLQDQFNKVLKFANQPRVEHNHEQNPLMQYFRNCSQEFVLALPILNMVHQKVLPLLGYKLNSGVCAALAKALAGNEQLLHGIILEGNGLNDHDVAQILEGLQTQEQIKSIVIKQNEVGEKCLAQLNKLFARKRPEHLEELRIVDCRMNPHTTDQLLSRLAAGPCFLSKVGLVNASFNAESARRLMKYVAQNKHLRHLDLKFNSLKQQEMLRLVRVLAADRKLVSIDLSLNQIWTGGEPKKVTDREVPRQQPGRSSPDAAGREPSTAVRDKEQGANAQDQRSREGSQQRNNTEYDEEKKHDHSPMKPTALEIERREVIECLSKLLKYNTSLQHLNLANTGLDEEIIRHLADEAMTKARSLLCLHLDDNPGITPENVAFTRARIRAQPEGIALHVEIPEGAFVQDANSSESQQKVQDFLRLKQIKRSIRAHDHSLALKNVWGKQFLLSRFLGHQQEIPGSAQWHVSSDNAPSEQCWMCQQWIYTIIFWSKTIGFRCASVVKSAAKRRVVQQITEAHPSLEPVDIEISDANSSRFEIKQKNLFALYEQDPDRPLICGDFNGWKPTRMVRVDEFAKSLDKTPKKDLLEVLMDGGLLRDMTFESVDQLNAEEKEAYDQLYRQTMRAYQTHWTEYVGEHVLYKRPYLANCGALKYLRLDDLAADEEPEPLYVYSCFTKPGKQNYVVIQQAGLANSGQHRPIPTEPDHYFVHRDMIDNRDEPVPAFFKKLQSVQRERLFDHARSVFKDWRPDNHVTQQKCLEHDFKYWKVANFCKNPMEVEAVKRVVELNFVQLKRVFHFLMSKSIYPGIGWQDYSSWAIQLKIPDERCPRDSVDRAFTAANVQIEKIEGNANNENSMCRFQFLEVVVRLAKAKFVDPGIEKQLGRALAKLIKENLIQNDYTDEWQGFRDKQLWTVEVSDMLEINLPGLRKVYDSHFAPRKKHMDIGDVVDLCTRSTDLIALEKDAIFCAGMSKMTYALETNHQDVYYNAVRFPEFLELLGRIAAFKYPGDAMGSLCAKMEPVLDAILATAGFTRLEPESKVIDESESDRDY